MPRCASPARRATSNRPRSACNREIERQILPDGGHASRDPGAVIEVLLELLPLRQAFASRNIAPPQALLNAIDRMMPMLRFFRHSDGTFAHFNGMGATPADLLLTLLAYDDTRGAPLSNAPYSAYQRLEAGGGVLIMDTGRAPPIEMSLEAHAGCLSFEFSSPRHSLHRRQLRHAGDGPRRMAAARARHRGAFDGRPSTTYRPRSFIERPGVSPRARRLADVRRTEPRHGVARRPARCDRAARRRTTAMPTASASCTSARVTLAADGIAARRRGPVPRRRRRPADPQPARPLRRALPSASLDQGVAAHRRPRRHC